MNKNDPETLQDLREVLTKFWLDTVESPDTPDFSDRLKASELLAKHILGDGKGSRVKPREPKRPATADILRLAAALEAE